MTLEMIHEEIVEMKKDMQDLKRHVLDMDRFMTEEEMKAFHAYQKEKKGGRLSSLEKVKRDRL